MSDIHVRQLEQYFNNSITHLIDVSDIKGKSEQDIHQIKICRSLSAFALSGLTGTDVKVTAAFVTDGERDQGIDGCYFDESKNTLTFIQSKWHKNGTKTIGKGDILKFLHGVKLVLSENWNTFTDKFKSHKAIIEQALLKPDVTVIVAIAFTGDNKLGDECAEVLKQFQDEQNSVSEFLETRTLDLRALHRYFRTATLAKQPPFTGLLLDWGQSSEPYQAIYGRICCEELAKFYSENGELLFEPNIRSFLGDGEVNNQIVSTLLNRPEEFWYLNNGITGICSRIKKSALGGGDNRQAGAFIFEGLQIVNGAQTIGSIAKAYEKAPEKVAKAFAMIKAISLEGAPLDFTDTVTISTNRQNRVEEKDFLALDPNQNRIKIEMASKGVQYVFRSGETVLDRAKGFDVTEAIIALACSTEKPDTSVLAKRNIGLLLDRKSNNYQTLVNSEIVGELIWKKVQTLRRIDGSICKLQSKLSNTRVKQIATHGNRIIAWAAFHAMALNPMDDESILDSFIFDAVDVIEKFINRNFPESYLAVFFKNTPKCIELSDELKKCALPKQPRSR